jgi:DNA adenine methylase
LYEFCRSTFDGSDELEMACKEWTLRKLTWSGMAHNGTYRSTKKFSTSAIVNLLDVGDLLQAVDVRITNLDYKECIAGPGEDVFIFLDPPYILKRRQELYGRYGDLHRSFNHQEFSQGMKSCTHDWLVTYNDREEIRSWFADYFLAPMDLTYTLRTKRPGQELIITNYETARAIQRRKGETAFAGND